MTSLVSSGLCTLANGQQLCRPLKAQELLLQHGSKQDGVLQDRERQGKLSGVGLLAFVAVEPLESGSQLLLQHVHPRGICLHDGKALGGLRSRAWSQATTLRIVERQHTARARLQRKERVVVGRLILRVAAGIPLPLGCSEALEERPAAGGKLRAKLDVAALCQQGEPALVELHDGWLVDLHKHYGHVLGGVRGTEVARLQHLQRWQLGKHPPAEHVWHDLHQHHWLWQLLANAVHADG
mmetsp:Transcript_33172/g.93932  ORF Transcript_33172/g.93932 Transcript_33172/m.93932 type:complete len:239 (-) Transcript_33172:1573-2289(-)